MPFFQIKGCLPHLLAVVNTIAKQLFSVILCTSRLCCWTCKVFNTDNYMPQNICTTEVPGCCRVSPPYSIFWREKVRHRDVSSHAGLAATLHLLSFLRGSPLAPLTCFFSVSVSVAIVFLRGVGAGHTHSPPPFTSRTWD